MDIKSNTTRKYVINIMLIFYLIVSTSRDAKKLLICQKESESVRSSSKILSFFLIPYFYNYIILIFIKSSIFV